jgi:hypothetical protein
VVVVVGGAGRVGTMWIGCPPLSRARVGTAVCSCAGGCPILCTPMTVRGQWCVERLGDRFLRRRWPTRPAIGRVWFLEPIGEDHARRSWSGGHFGPHEPGEFAGDGGGDDGATVLAGGEAPEPST